MYGREQNGEFRISRSGRHSIPIRIFPVSHSTVAVLVTSHDTVIDDYRRLMELAKYRDTLNFGSETAVHVTLAWHHYFPSASTEPWQLDGVLGALIGEGFPVERIFAWYNSATGISISKGWVLNRHISVIGRYGVSTIFSDGHEERILYEPKASLRVIPSLFPKGITFPKRLLGANILHLPTLRTDILSTLAGALRITSDGFLDGPSRLAENRMHEFILDALTLQREISAGTFAVMDGVFAGGGANPRNLVPQERNIILASADTVALDAVALRLAGYDPMHISYIRMAHEAGLGSGELSEIDVVGADIDRLTFRLEINESQGARRIRQFERMTDGTFFQPLARMASTMYHDWYYYLAFGEGRIREAARGPWGKVFESYRR